ncbi:hypothetical protein HGRIS_014988 [Hohenbuehelia grisea]|uniref:NACHT domain-containing protein n=1 Tax=Hohenbuehelia grisea TaxID=104357 RepID=A0ABR3IQV4_9AGAR
MEDTAGKKRPRHVHVCYVKGSHLPKLKIFVKRKRSLYLKLSVKQEPKQEFEIHSLTTNSSTAPPINFFVNLPVTLHVTLHAKRICSNKSILLGSAEVELESTINSNDTPVTITRSPGAGLTEDPVVVLKFTVTDKFKPDEPLIKSIEAKLTLNPTLEKILENINLLVKIGSAVAEVNPIAQVVFGVVEVVTSECVDFIKQHDSVKQLLEEVGSACLLIADWDDRELDVHRPKLLEVCEYFFPVIYQCLYLTYTLSQRRQSRDAVDEVVLHRQKHLRTIIERVRSSTQLDTQGAVFRTLDTVADINNRSILDSLCHTAQDQPEGSKKCLSGTRVQLISRMRSWVLDAKAERALLLHGPAGYGKSAVVHTIAQDLERSGFCLVPFFAFNRSAQDRSLSQLIPSWARRLAEMNAKYMQHLHTVNQSDPRRLRSTDVADQKTDFLLTGLTAGINEGKPIVFVIDALDECPEKDSPKLFRLLRELLHQDFPSFIRFIFTFRRDGDLLAKFKDSDVRSIAIDEEGDSHADIRVFTANQLGPDGEALVKDIPKDSPLWPTFCAADLINVVANSSQSSFQCAAVLCDTLSTLIEVNARRTLVEMLVTGRVTSLYDTYRQILDIHFPVKSVRATLFPRIMAWILLVRSPQPAPVFRAFASQLLSPNEQLELDIVLRRLGSFVSGVGSTSIPISPLHTSLRDFLLDKKESNIYCVDIGPGPQQDVAWACLRIMNTQLKFNICNLESPFALNKDVMDLDAKVQQYISLELRYACTQAAHHLKASLPLPRTPNDDNLLAAHISKNVALELGAFLNDKFLFWLEAQSCMSVAGMGPGTILPVFLAWAISALQDDLAQILKDSIRFERRFREGYRLSSMQCYYSGLLFSPSNCQLARRYLKKLPLPMTVREGQEQDWPLGEPLVIHIAGQCSSITISADGKRIASGSDDRTIRIWDAETGEQLGDALKGHENWVTSVAFSSDGKRIASGSGDRTVRIWDAETGEQLGDALKGHTREVTSVAFSSDGKRITSGSYDRTVRIWDAETGEQLGDALKGHGRGVTSVAFSSDGKRIASGSGDRTVRIWDAETGEQLGDALKGHEDWVRSVAISSDGKRIASGSDDRTVRIWDAETGEQLGDALKGHEDRVRSVAFSSDGKRIASGSGDRTVRIWNAETGEQLGDALKGHEDRVRSVAFSSDGKRIASGSDDGTVRIWNAETGEQLGDALKGHESAVTSVAISSDGKRIASGSGDRTVRICDPTAPSTPSTLYNPTPSAPWPSDELFLTRNSFHRRDDWLCTTADDTPVFWIPPTFRHHSFVLHPCIFVLSARPKVVITVNLKANN